MEKKNINDINELDTLENEDIIDTEEILDQFTDEEEIMELTSEKLEEVNKKLPNWSIEPPHKFLTK